MKVVNLVSQVFFLLITIYSDIFFNRLWLCFWGRPKLSFISFKLR